MANDMATPHHNIWGDTLESPEVSTLSSQAPNMEFGLTNNMRPVDQDGLQDAATFSPAK